MSYNTTIIEKIFRGHTMAVFANPPLPPLNGPLWGMRPYAKNMAKWRLPEKSIKNAVQKR